MPIQDKIGKIIELELTTLEGCFENASTCLEKIQKLMDLPCENLKAVERNLKEMTNQLRSLGNATETMLIQQRILLSLLSL